MKKMIISAVVIIGFGLAVYAFQRGNEGTPGLTASPSVSVSANPSVSVTPTVTVSVSPTVSPVAASTPKTTAVSGVKTFKVIGQPFSFTPAQITVNKGDTVKIVFQNASGTHDWNLDEFNAHTGVIQGGQEQTIQFVADKTGAFEYYCSVGTHRQLGMKGNIIVK